MIARLIGYWKSSLRDPYALPRHFEAPLALGVRSMLVDYLRRGRVVNQYRGHSWCRYGCRMLNGSAEQTDGEWIWPTDLPHYIEMHGVALPPEFLEHVFFRGTRGQILQARKENRQPFSLRKNHVAS